MRLEQTGLIKHVQKLLKYSNYKMCEWQLNVKKMESHFNMMVKAPAAAERDNQFVHYQK